MPVSLRRAAESLREQFSCSRHRVLRADRGGSVSTDEISALDAEPTGDVGDGLKGRPHSCVLDVADVATGVDGSANLRLSETESDPVVPDPFPKPGRDL